MRSPAFKTYTIRFLFLLTGGCALALGIWKAFVYEPPTHKIPLYEKAPMTHRLSATIGPNRVEIKSVARNDRDGTVYIQSGKGNSVDAAIPNQQQLIDCGGWLDAVQLELTPGPDLLEILEVRIFDHQTRTLLNQEAPVYGWQVVKPNLIQIFGLGKQLPELVDVWLRVHSYQSDDPVSKMLPAAGNTVNIEDGVLTLTEIHDGFRSWDSKTGFAPVPGKHHNDIGLLLDWHGPGMNRRYQVTAVAKDGERHVDDCFYQFGSLQGPRQVLIFNLPRPDIQHFELRPFGGRHRFFFEAVRLPKPQGQAFSKPPMATIPISGVETDIKLAAFQPLTVKASVRDGDNATGVTSNGVRSQITPQKDGPIDVGKSFTLTLDWKGISKLPCTLQLLDSQTGTPFTNPTSGGRQSANRGNGGCSASVYRIPLGQVQAIELSL